MCSRAEGGGCTESLRDSVREKKAGREGSRPLGMRFGRMRR
jgi:hypothetical protein